MLLTPLRTGTAHVVLSGRYVLTSTTISARNALINDVQAPAAAEARAEAKAEGCWSISILLARQCNSAGHRNSRWSDRRCYKCDIGAAGAEEGAGGEPRRDPQTVADGRRRTPRRACRHPRRAVGQRGNLRRDRQAARSRDAIVRPRRRTARESVIGTWQVIGEWIWRCIHGSGPSQTRRQIRSSHRRGEGDSGGGDHRRRIHATKARCAAWPTPPKPASSSRYLSDRRRRSRRPRPSTASISAGSS